MKWNSSNVIGLRVLLMPFYQIFSLVGMPSWRRNDSRFKDNSTHIAKKSALIFFMPTPEVSKPPDVARLVIGTFLETLVSKCISSRTIQASRPHALSTPFAFVDVAVRPASNYKWDGKGFNAISAAT